MKGILFGLMISALSLSAYADNSSGPDGFWLKNGLSACPKVYSNGQVLTTATQEDMLTCLSVMPWVMGYVAARWEDNRMFDYVSSFLQQAIQLKKNKKDVKSVNQLEHDISMRKLTVPLYGLPTVLPPEQATAIILKYLDDHPEKWKTNATEIVSNALHDAFLVNDKK